MKRTTAMIAALATLSACATSTDIGEVAYGPLPTVVAPASAKWVGRGKNDLFAIYDDSTTIQRKGNLVRMWTLYDFPKPQQEGNDIRGKVYHSLALMQEYDCGRDRKRLISLIQYSGNKGTGDVVYTVRFPEEEWSSPDPGSVSESSLEVACGGKPGEGPEVDDNGKPVAWDHNYFTLDAIT